MQRRKVFQKVAFIFLVGRRPDLVALPSEILLRAKFKGLLCTRPSIMLGAGGIFPEPHSGMEVSRLFAGLFSH